jgi:hypothetical protein
MRLSELLERIRPAGTPGAADDATSAVESAAAEEVAALVAQLERFGQEATAIIDAAEREAEAIGADAERRASQVRSSLAERVAVAQATTDGADTERWASERARLRIEADAEIDRRRRRAAEARDQLADRVLERIWAIVGDVPGGPS